MDFVVECSNCGNIAEPSGEILMTGTKGYFYKFPDIICFCGGNCTVTPQTTQPKIVPDCSESERIQNDTRKLL